MDSTDGSARTGSTAAPAPAQCFHCGDPVPPGGRFGLFHAGGWRAVCCPGCEAVASAIVGQGLADYYRLREAPAGTPAAGDEDPGIYDDPDVQASFVACVDGDREAVLLLDGLRCAACAWLNEQALARIPGVRGAEVNYATHRARVRWDPARVKPSDILLAVRRLGYAAHPYDAARAGEVARGERRALLWRLFVAGFGMMQVMMYAYPAYVAGDGEIPADVQQLLRWAGLVLTVPVLLYSGLPFLAGAWRDLSRLRAGMDVPVALGIVIAFAASVHATLAGQGEVYFDSLAMFVFLLLAARLLELSAREQAARTLAHLGRLLPASACRLKAYPRSMESERVPVGRLAPGDHVLVKRGEAFPADAMVAHGEGVASEALLTGEARPVRKRPGGAVIGGSLNVAGPLVVRVRAVGRSTVLASILELTERAAAARPTLVRLVDAHAPLFVLCVIALAGVAGAWWWAVDPGRALPVAVAVLVATCPCALSLAAPIAHALAAARLAGMGVIARRGAAVEAMAGLTDVVFDKTGTLTADRMIVRATRTHGALPATRCLQLAAALETVSEHPLARAFDAYRVPGLVPRRVRVAPGRGVEAVLDGRACRIGTRGYAAGLARCAPPAGDAGNLWLAAEGEWLASFELQERLRPGAEEAVAALAGMGIAVHLLSGDAQEPVRRAAARLGMARWAARADPARKERYVARLQARGRSVAMVGDGMNDAGVLARADVSFAMGAGARLAQMQASVVVLSGDLRVLSAAIGEARRARRIVRQNLAWAFAYNVSVLPLAIAGQLTPWMAAIGMSLSSILVVLNAMRLRPGRSAPSRRAGTRAQPAPQPA